MRLKDRVVLIGGCGSGMGRAMALLFAQEGVRVAAVARRQAEIDGTVRRIEAIGGTILALTADMTSAPEAKRAVIAAVGKYGRLDAFCSSAGGNYKHVKDVEEIGEDFFDSVLRNHIKSIFHGVHAAIPHLKATGGAILTIAAGYKTQRDSNFAYDNW